MYTAVSCSLQNSTPMTAATMGENTRSERPFLQGRAENDFTVAAQNSTQDGTSQPWGPILVLSVWTSASIHSSKYSYDGTLTDTRLLRCRQHFWSSTGSLQNWGATRVPGVERRVTLLRSHLVLMFKTTDFPPNSMPRLYPSVQHAP